MGDVDVYLNCTERLKSSIELPSCIGETYSSDISPDELETCDSGISSSHSSEDSSSSEDDTNESVVGNDNIRNSPIFKEIYTDELEKLRQLFAKHDMELRIAGGAVRDILLGKAPHDIDFATDAHPEEMVKMFQKEGVRMIEYGSRAIEHGTVIVRFNDKINYEITTLRNDVTTNGRHAAVQFHKDWKKDAERRDLTVNALFLGLDGIVYDYVGGRDDLESRRVRFVGNAEKRITEDYLRIMRYFRFYGKIATEPDNHDANTLNTISRACDGLTAVAGERIWIELKKILADRFADHLLKHIIDLGVGKHIGLPERCDLTEFKEVYQRRTKCSTTELALAAALLANKQQVSAMKQRLKVSKIEYATMLHIIEHRSNYQHGNSKCYQDMIVDSKEDSQHVRDRCVQLAAYMGDKHVYDTLKSWVIPKFSFSAKIFLKSDVEKRKIGEFVKQVKDEWKRLNFEATQTELVKFAQEIITEGGDSRSIG